MPPKKSPKDQIVVGGLAPPKKQIGAGDEALLASNIRLMAERLGVEPSFGIIGNMLRIGGPTSQYTAVGADRRDVLIEIHEKLRAALVTRQAIDHDILNRVRGTHAIRRRRDADWYAAQRSGQ